MKHKVSRKTCTFPQNRWYDDECKELRVELKTVEPLENQQEYTAKYKNYKRVTQKKKREFQGYLISEIQSTTNSTKQWALLRQNTDSLPPTCPVTLAALQDKFENTRGNFQCDYFNQEKEDYINEFMETLLQSSPNSANSGIDPAVSAIMNNHFTEEEVANCIQQLKSKKACGLDGIPTEAIKAARSTLTPPLTLLFNYALDKGQFPSS